MIKITLKTFLLLGFLLVSVHSAVVSARACTFSAAKIIGNFKPQSIIGSSSAINKGSIEKMRKALEDLHKRVEPGVGKFLKCVAIQRKAFITKYGNRNIKKTVIAAFRRYGIPAKSDNGRDNYKSAKLYARFVKQTSYIVERNFYSQTMHLNRIRQITKLLPEAWRGYAVGVGNSGSVPAWVKASAVKDLNQRIIGVLKYLKYFDVAYNKWSEVNKWYHDFAWPTLITIQGRKGWHENNIRNLGRKRLKLDREWQAMAERGQDQSTLNPRFKVLNDLTRQQNECLTGLGHAGKRIRFRIELAARIPLIESYDIPARIPTMGKPPQAPKLVPVSCMMSLDSTLATSLAYSAGNNKKVATKPATNDHSAQPVKPGKKPTNLNVDELNPNNLLKVCASCMDAVVNYFAVKQTYPAIKKNWLVLTRQYETLGGDAKLDRFKTEFSQLSKALVKPISKAKFNLVKEYLNTLKGGWRRHALASDRAFGHLKEGLKNVLSYLFDADTYDGWLAPSEYDVSTGQSLTAADRNAIKQSHKARRTLDRQLRLRKKYLQQKINVLQTIKKQLALADKRVAALEKEILGLYTKANACLKKCKPK